MIASLTLAAALLAPSAPIRPETGPAGPAPHVLDLQPSPDGKVRIAVLRKQKAQMAPAIAPAPGNPNAAVPVKEVEFESVVVVELGDLKDLVITTVGGKEVSLADATEKLKDGGVVLASADGKKVDPKFLKLFKDETFVLLTPELTKVPGSGTTGGGGAIGRPGIGRPIVRPLPAPVPAPGRVKPAVILPVNPPVEQAPVDVPDPISLPAETK